MSAEPQRNALTDLISRFTADRDRLIAVVQDCEARVEDLVARSRGQEPQAASSVPSVPPAELETMRSAMRELHDEIQVLRTREPNVAVNSAVGALATESQQRKEAIEGLQAECTRTRNEVAALNATVADVRAAVSRVEADVAAGPEAVWQRVERALAPLSETTRVLGSRLAEVERGLRSVASAAAAAPPAPAEGAPAVSPDAVAELRAAMVSVDRRVDERVEDLWRRVEQLVGPIGAETSATAARGRDAETAMRDQLASTAGSIATLAAAVERLERSALERNDGATQVAALETRLRHLQDEQRQRFEGAASETARAGRVLVALTDRVARLEVIVALPPPSVLGSLYDEVRDALRTRAGAVTEGIRRELWAWLGKPAAMLRFVSRGTNG